MDKAEKVAEVERLLAELETEDKTASTGVLTSPEGYPEDRGSKLGECRLYRPEEKLPTSAPAGAVGRYIRGAVTGRWGADDAELRQQGTTPGAAGGFLLPDPVSVMTYDLARSASVAVAAGMRTIMADSTTLNIVGVADDAVTTWVPENDPIPEDVVTLELHRMEFCKVASLIRSSRELIEDGSNVADVLEMSLRGGLGLAIDRACLFGSGAGQPLGVFGAIPPANQINLGAAITDFGVFAQAAQLIGEANGPKADRLAMIASPRTYSVIDQLVEAVNLQSLKPNETYAAMRKLQTTSCPDDVIIIGDFSQLILGLRLPVSIETSGAGGEGANGDAFARYQVLIRAVARCDTAVIRPGFFAAITNIA